MSLKEKVEKYLKRLEFRTRIALLLVVVFIIVFLAFWSTIDFTLPAFLTDVRLVEKASLFAFWTIGAILFGVVLAAFIISRELGTAIRAK